MKKILSAVLLSVVSFSSIAFAGEAVFIEEPMYVEPYFEDPYLEPIELEPIPFDPEFIEPEMPMIPEDPYYDDPYIVITLDAELTEDGKVALKWTPYDDFMNDFLWYKIMHSTVYELPYYPIDPELDFYEDPRRTGYIHEDPALGENYYRICVITTDDRRGCSNPRTVFVEDPVFRGENEDRPESEIREENIREDRPDEDPALRDKIKQNNTRDGFLKKLFAVLGNNIGLVLTLLAVIIAVSGFTFATRNKRKSISKFMNQIDDTYSEYKMKAKRCEAELYRLSDIIDDELKGGKLDDSAYQLLRTRIEGYMVDIQKQIVNEKFGGLPAQLKDEMFKMMEDGEITETEFDTMQKLIKRSELSATEQDSLLAQIKDFKKQDEMMKKKGRKN